MKVEIPDQMFDSPEASLGVFHRHPTHEPMHLVPE